MKLIKVENPAEYDKLLAEAKEKYGSENVAEFADKSYIGINDGKI